MTDIAYSNRSVARSHSIAPGISVLKATLDMISRLAKTAIEVVREWWIRYRSRRELILYSHHERNDLAFAAEVNTEIAKPFWRK